MSKLFDESLEAKTEKIIKNCEGLIELSYKASGFSIMDTLSELDAEKGAMVGGFMTCYKDAKDLAVTQAKTMDKILKELDELKGMNRELRKQNEELQRMLRDAIVRLRNKN